MTHDDKRPSVEICLTTLLYIAILMTRVCAVDVFCVRAGCQISFTPNVTRPPLTQRGTLGKGNENPKKRDIKAEAVARACQEEQTKTSLTDWQEADRWT